MLPSIANTLGVSIDVLLGNDKIITEQRIQNYISEYKKLTSNKEDKRIILDLAYKAFNEFSYDHRIMMLYVNSLKIYSTEDNTDEIIRICKTVLDTCDDPILCSDASYHISGLKSCSDRKMFLNKYIEYGQDWNWYKIFSRDSEEGKIMMQHDIIDKWWHLNTYIYIYGDLWDEDPSRTISHEEKIALIKKCERIFYAVFDDNDYGEFTFYIGQYNEFLAREYAALKNREETLTCLDKAVTGWISYFNLPKEYTYRNVLLTHRPYVYEKKTDTYGDLRRFKELVDTCSQFDFIRNTEEFRLIYYRLCSAII